MDACGIGNLQGKLTETVSAHPPCGSNNTRSQRYPQQDISANGFRNLKYDACQKNAVQALPLGSHNHGLFTFSLFHRLRTVILTALYLLLDHFWLLLREGPAS